MTEEQALRVTTPEDEVYMPKEKAVLRFARAFALDHMGITDGDLAELKEHLSDEQIVELTLSCALTLGFGRLITVLQLYDESCPLPAAPVERVASSLT